MPPDLKEGKSQQKNEMVARKPFCVTLTKADYDQFASWDTSIVDKYLPPALDMLTLHGLADTVVPP